MKKAPPTPPILMIYKAKDGWRWLLQAANGKVVAESGEALAQRPRAYLAVYLQGVLERAHVKFDEPPPEKT